MRSKVMVLFLVMLLISCSSPAAGSSTTTSISTSGSTLEPPTSIPASISPPSTATKEDSQHPTLHPTQLTALAPPSTSIVLIPQSSELARWQEYEEALGRAIYERVSRVDVICEWRIFGRDEGKVYIWMVCSGYHPSDLAYLYTAASLAVVFLGPSGEIKAVGTPDNTSGPSYGVILQSLFPPEILEKFENPPDSDYLLEHLATRRNYPEPPLIVLSATQTP